MSQEQPLFDTSATDDPLDLLDHLDGTAVPSGVWPQTLADLMEIMTRYFEREGEGENAPKRAQDLCILLGSYLGGRQIYLPRGDRLKTAIRDIQIWYDFTGHNIDELQRKYGITANRLYTILAQQRSLHRREFQGRLFQPETEAET